MQETEGNLWWHAKTMRNLKWHEMFQVEIRGKDPCHYIGWLRLSLSLPRVDLHSCCCRVHFTRFFLFFFSWGETERMSLLSSGCANAKGPFILCSSLFFSSELPNITVLSILSNVPVERPGRWVPRRKKEGTVAQHNAPASLPLSPPLSSTHFPWQWKRDDHHSL